ncbi:MAG: hypothetical protein Q9208_007079 [Pyrenodesmia sp. 3 TL-2023]
MFSLLPPQIPRWGFYAPRHDLLRIEIDTTSPLATPPTLTPQKDTAPILGKENKKPGLIGAKIDHFGSSSGMGYFGGPILVKSTLTWQSTYFTRASGDICGWYPTEFPGNLPAITHSVGVMAGNGISQSGVWVGPRIFLSTLHMHAWRTGTPTEDECKMLIDRRTTFNVETEINARLLSDHSPKLQLISAEPKFDLGIFMLLDTSKARDQWAVPELLIERDEAGQSTLSPGRPVGCIGYSGRIHEEDRVKILQQAAVQLVQEMPLTYSSVEAMDLDDVVKAESRCFAPGTLDVADADPSQILYGVSSTLWKGSSGGPCVILSGDEGGRILGLGMMAPGSQLKQYANIVHLYSERSS